MPKHKHINEMHCFDADSRRLKIDKVMILIIRAVMETITICSTDPAFPS